MLTLKELLELETGTETKLLDKFSHDPKHLSGSLVHKNFVNAIYAICEEGDPQKAKQHFHVMSLLVAYRVIHFNDRLFDYALPRVCSCILSDNLPYLQHTFSNLTYSSSYIAEKTHAVIPVPMDEMVLAGHGVIFVHTIQQFLKNDRELIARNLDIIETLYIQKKASVSEALRIDFHFFKALFEGNKAGCETALSALVSPGIHKKRNDNELLRQYISQPALGYAKLAWMKGLEVATDSPLIPRELLPVRPNKSYPAPYNFLK